MMAIMMVELVSVPMIVRDNRWQYRLLMIMVVVGGWWWFALAGGGGGGGCLLWQFIVVIYRVLMDLLMILRLCSISE